MKSSFLPLLLASSAILHGDTLLEHSFAGDALAPLNGSAPAINEIRPVAWNAGAIIAANGQVNDATNTDQGLVFDLGSSWKFKAQSTYTVTLGFSQLSNGILFAGFRTTNPSGGVQVQTQGTSFSLRVREISGSDNVGIFQWPGGVFTDGALSYDTNTADSFTLTIETHDLTDATVSVGTAQVTVDLTVNAYRYFFAGYEDPTSGTSDAKFDLLSFTGPALPAMPQARLVSYSPQSGEAKLAWASTLDQSYTLQKSADLKTWVAADNSDLNPFIGTGAELEFTDLPAATQQFYRVIRP